MRVEVTKIFIEQAILLEPDSKIKIFALIEEIELSETLIKFNPTPIIGFPHIQFFEIQGYQLSFRLIPRGIELTAITKDFNFLSYFI